MKLFYIAILVNFIALAVSMYGLYLSIISNDYYYGFYYCFLILIVIVLILVTFKQYKKW